MEKQELQTIEPDIEAMESEKAELEAILNKGGSNYTELAETQEKIDSLEMSILEKMERWEYLLSKEA